MRSAVRSRRLLFSLLNPTGSLADSPVSIFWGDADTSTKQTENSKSFKYPKVERALKKSWWIEESDDNIDIAGPDSSASQTLLS